MNYSRVFRSTEREELISFGRSLIDMATTCRQQYTSVSFTSDESFMLDDAAKVLMKLSDMIDKKLRREP